MTRSEKVRQLDQFGIFLRNLCPMNDVRDYEVSFLSSKVPLITEYLKIFSICVAILY